MHLCDKEQSPSIWVEPTKNLTNLLCQTQKAYSTFDSCFELLVSLSSDNQVKEKQNDFVTVQDLPQSSIISINDPPNTDSLTFTAKFLLQ